jgi:PadR family transcriptional regulator AphA
MRRMQISEPAEYALLGLLQARPMHGYEMFQEFERGTLGEIIHLEMSQLYAFLKKLERLGYIEATVKEQGSRPPRKVYHLREEGRALFHTWLLEPVEKPRDIRIHFLIKLYFLRPYASEQTIALVQRQAEACERFLQHLELRQQASIDDRQDPEHFLAHVVLRSRIYQTRSLLAWLTELTAELRDESRPSS